MNKEVPVTYEGVMVGVAEVTDDINAGGTVVKVRLNEDSLFKPFFIEHTAPCLSFREEAIVLDEISESNLNSELFIYDEPFDIDELGPEGDE